MGIKMKMRPFLSAFAQLPANQLFAQDNQAEKWLLELYEMLDKKVFDNHIFVNFSKTKIKFFKYIFGIISWTQQFYSDMTNIYLLEYSEKISDSIYLRLD